jgi:hypothetical protein
LIEVKSSTFVLIFSRRSFRASTTLDLAREDAKKSSVFLRAFACGTASRFSQSLPLHQLSQHLRRRFLRAQADQLAGKLARQFGQYIALRGVVVVERASRHVTEHLVAVHTSISPNLVADDTSSAFACSALASLTVMSMGGFPWAGWIGRA